MQTLRKPTSAARRVARVIANVVASIVAKMPGGDWLIRKSALAPVKIKNRFFEKAMGRIASKSWHADEFIVTNCGIADRLRLLIPRKKSDLIYGRPGHQISDRATLELATLLAARTGVFVDVGANEGLYSITIASALGARVDIHLFEADEIVFKRLASNLQRNNIRAHAHNIAVGGVSGTAIFHRNLSTDFSGSLHTFFRGTNETVPVEVPVTTLSEYLKSRDISHACVKVDVEGSGVEVWEGMRGALERVDWLIMEIIGPEWDAGLPGRVIAESGWAAYYIRDRELRQWTSGPYGYVDQCYNWLFCPASSAQLSSLLQGTRLNVTAANTGNAPA